MFRTMTPLKGSSGSNSSGSHEWRQAGSPRNSLHYSRRAPNGSFPESLDTGIINDCDVFKSDVVPPGSQLPQPGVEVYKNRTRRRKSRSLDEDLAQLTKKDSGSFTVSDDLDYTFSSSLTTNKLVALYLQTSSADDTMADDYEENPNTAPVFNQADEDPDTFESGLDD